MKTFLKRITISLLLLAAIWLAGYITFAAQIPRLPKEDTERTDAIVVLTGGTGRINYGVGLLRQGKAEMLFITGVEDNVKLQQLLGEDNVNSDVIMLGYDARNTIGNAVETALWVKKRNIQSLRLVTANYHMPRALQEFRFTLPEVNVIPDPVFPEGYAVAKWWNPSHPSGYITLSEYHKFLAAAARHWLMRIAGERPLPQ